MEAIRTASIPLVPPDPIELHSPINPDANSTHPKTKIDGSRLNTQIYVPKEDPLLTLFSIPQTNLDPSLREAVAGVKYSLRDRLSDQDQRIIAQTLRRNYDRTKRARSQMKFEEKQNHLQHLKIVRDKTLRDLNDRIEEQTRLRSILERIKTAGCTCLKN